MPDLIVRIAINLGSSACLAGAIAGMISLVAAPSLIKQFAALGAFIGLLFGITVDSLDSTTIHTAALGCATIGSFGVLPELFILTGLNDRYRGKFQDLLPALRIVLILFAVITLGPRLFKGIF